LDVSEVLGYNGGAAVYGTRDEKLISYDGHNLIPIATSGPYRQLGLSTTNERVVLSAATDSGTFFFNLSDHNRRIGGLRAGGVASLGGENLLLVSGGFGAIHSTEGAISKTGIRFESRFPTSVRWAGSNVIVQSISGLTLSTSSDAMTSSREENLASPEEGTCGEFASLTTSQDGHWATATAVCQRTRNRTAYVWNLQTPDAAPQQLPVGTTGLIAFLDGSSLVTVSPGGRLTYLRRNENGWAVTATRNVNEGNVLAITVDQGDRAIIALTAKSRSEPPTILRLDPMTLVEQARMPLNGASGYPQIHALSDGRVATTYGAGQLVILSRDLREMQTLTLRFATLITDIVELKLSQQLLISSDRGTFTYDLHTHSLRPTDDWVDGPSRSFDVSSNDRYVVTSEVLHDIVEVLQVAPTALRSRACDAIGRDLTDEEWREYFDTAIVSPFRVCPQLRTISAPNGYQNPQQWAVAGGDVGPFKLGMTLGQAVEAGLMTRDSRGQCSDYRKVGSWLEPSGIDALSLDFQTDQLDAPLLGIVVRGRAFRTAGGAGVGDNRTQLINQYGRKLKNEPVMINGREHSDPVVESSNGDLLVFELDSQDIVTEIIATRRPASGNAEIYLGC
jgi:hypothetical protein